MSRATSGFLAGLVSGGLGTYLKMKDVERADAKEKRDQETFDHLKDQREREQATQRRTDAAIQDYAGLADGVVDTNTSGFSPSQVTQLMKQGGQAAVDAQASRIADAEMAAGGAPSKVSSMLPNFKDPSGAPVQGAPTVTMRQLMFARASSTPRTESSSSPRPTMRPLLDMTPAAATRSSSSRLWAYAA